MLAKSAHSFLVQTVIGVLYPAFCRSCDRKLHDDERVFCDRCLHRLEDTKLGNWVEALTFPAHIDEAYSGWWFGEEMQDIVHALKYDEMVSVGRRLGRQLGRLFLSEFSQLSLDVATSVPLHPARERERGSNQSTILSEGVCSEIGLPFNGNLLKRRKNTISQTTLTAEERTRNVEDAFTAAASVPERVLIVDDVLTTGSTLSACASVLKRSGADFVAVLTAGTPYLHRRISGSQ